MKFLLRGAVVSVVLVASGGVLPIVSAAAEVPFDVYYGPPPTYGGEPAIGETASSFWARTGDDLPRSAPRYGGDRVAGESDDSYQARTGHTTQ